MAREFFVVTLPPTNDTETVEIGERKEYDYDGFVMLMQGDKNDPNNLWQVELTTLRDDIAKLSVEALVNDDDVSWLSRSEFPDCRIIMHHQDLEPFKDWCKRSGITIVGECHCGKKDAMQLEEVLALLETRS